MRKLVAFFIFIAIVVFVVKRYVPSSEQMLSKKAEETAEQRVRMFLKGWQDGGTSANGAAQDAVCFWATGKRFIADRDELEMASDRFDRWRKDRDLYRSLTSYEVGKTERIEHTEHPYTIVEVVLNGRHMKLGVPDDERPIFWLDRF